MGLTRREFWSRIGLDRETDHLTAAAYHFAEVLELEKPRQGHSHDSPWHVAFHGSEFPGDNPKACPRKALYTMMDLPRGVMRRQLRQVADAGKDIELQIVKRWWQAGYLLSAPPLPDVPQTQFIDPDVWLTCTTDAILLHPGSNRGVVNEVKSKSADVIAQMKRLIRGPDKSHVNQVKTEIGMAHEQGRQLVLRCFNTGRLPIQLGLNGSTQLICPEHMTDKCLREEWIEPVVSGRIYYVSRDSPADTFEFYYDYDPRFMKVGRSKLKLWKDWFLEGKLPQTQFEDKRFSHPFGWLWTKDSPCLYCDYGEICREDHKVAVAQKEPINLTESAGIQQALEYREDYDLNLVKVATERYWDERSKYVSD